MTPMRRIALAAPLALSLCLPLSSPVAVAAPQSVAPGAAPAKGPTCFWVRDIDNYTVNDDEDVVYLKVRPKQVWKLVLNSRCIGLGDRQALPIRTFAGVGSVCNALDIDLQTRFNGMPQRCFVRDLRPLSPAEAAALPKRLQP